LLPVVSSRPPNLLASAIRIAPRQRDCRFSSVVSVARPANSGAAHREATERRFDRDGSSRRTPSARACSSARSLLRPEVKREGSRTAGDVPGAERIHGDCQHQGRIDATGKPQPGALEAVLAQ
jgi:hypothetical protein